MMPIVAFALKYFGLISSVIKEGITVGPEIAKLVSDGYTAINKVQEEDRAPTDEEWGTLDALEEYWRTRLHSDD